MDRLYLHEVNEPTAIEKLQIVWHVLIVAYQLTAIFNASY